MKDFSALTSNVDPNAYMEHVGIFVYHTVLCLRRQMELAQVQPNLFSYSSLARSAALWQQGVQVLHAVDARRLEATWSHSFFRFLPVIFRVIHGVVHSINGKDSVKTVIAEIAMKKGNARAKYFCVLTSASTSFCVYHEQGQKMPLRDTSPRTIAATGGIGILRSHTPPGWWFGTFFIFPQ